MGDGRHWRWAAGAWWVALAVGSHWPRLSLPGQSSVALGLDKWLHVVAFGGLAALLAAARLAGRGRPWRSLGLGVLLAAIYLPVDEATQSLVPGRQASLGDVLAGAIGVAGVAVLWAVALAAFQRRQRREPGQATGFVSHARTMAGLTLVSRFFGLARDSTLGIVLGFGAVFDAFALAFMIPNLFRRLFGEGALAGAFVPRYGRLVRDGQATVAVALSRRVVALLVRVLLVIALLGSAVLAMLLVLADLDQRGALTAGLTLVSIWYMPLVCVAAILAAMLQVHGRFAIPAASPILLNLFIIGAAMVAVATVPADAGLWMRAAIIIAAVVAAGVVQVIWHLGGLARAHVIWSVASDDRAAAAQPYRQLLGHWLPTMIGLAVFQINTLADGLIALFFSGEAGQTLGLFGRTLAYPMQLGSVAVVGAAARLYEFPLGVFGIAVATAIFPALARTSDDRAAFSRLLRQGLRLAVFIGLPASVGLVLVRDLLPRAVYPTLGQLDPGDAARIGGVLLGYATAIWAYSANQILVRAFYAADRPTTPMWVSLAMVGLNLTLNLLLIWPLGAAGLAWSTAICAAIQFAVLLVLVRRHVDRPAAAEVWSAWGRTALASAVMAGVVAALLWPVDPAALGWAATVGLLLGVVAIGAAVFALAARLLAMPELRWLVRRQT